MANSDLTAFPELDLEGQWQLNYGISPENVIIHKALDNIKNKLLQGNSIETLDEREKCLWNQILDPVNNSPRSPYTGQPAITSRDVQNWLMSEKGFWAAPIINAARGFGRGFGRVVGGPPPGFRGLSSLGIPQTSSRRGGRGTGRSPGFRTQKSQGHAPSSVYQRYETPPYRHGQQFGYRQSQRRTPANSAVTSGGLSPVSPMASTYEQQPYQLPQYSQQQYPQLFGQPFRMQQYAAPSSSAEPSTEELLAQSLQELDFGQFGGAEQAQTPQRESRFARFFPDQSQ